MGDLIIPVLDPTGEDRREFIRWVLNAANMASDENVERLDKTLAEDYSAASYASLRSQLKATKPATIDELLEVVRDHIPPAITLTRRFQTLQALVNCTRRKLLPDPQTPPEKRQEWELEIQKMERMGVQ